MTLIPTDRPNCNLIQETYTVVYHSKCKDCITVLTLKSLAFIFKITKKKFKKALLTTKITAEKTKKRKHSSQEKAEM